MLRIAIGLIVGIIIMYIVSTCSYVSFGSPTLPEVSRTGFNTYAAGFEYDTTHLAGDKQILADSTLQNTGPLAEIQPMVDAHQADSSDLFDGVVVARIIVHPDTLAFNGYTYAHYAIADTGVVYWFVRNNRTYFVPRDTTLPVDSSQALDLGMPHPEHWKQALARWQWAVNDEQAWVTCAKNRCCYGM